jgi:hypothetical protein
MPTEKHAVQRRPAEWGYSSSKSYANPFADVELDVEFTAPDGSVRRVPAFWAGDGEWRVRFAPERTGEYEFRTVCSDESNEGLHGNEGSLVVEPYDGSNELLERGPLSVAEDGHLEHDDGTPFFWLGDTWWMGLSDRLEWPEEFERLAADRAEKGFTLVQFVMGLYPDMDAFDRRAENEAGYPWTEGFERINPAYFDAADERIARLVQRELLPCILGCWGYYLPWLGVDRMKRHWRYVVARYGAYPAIYCLAGETDMPFYRSRHPEDDAERQRAGWSEVGAYVREIDPYGHPVTTHPGGFSAGSDELDDAGVLDFDMIQTGQSGRDADVVAGVEQIRAAPERDPDVPVVNGEGFYEANVAGNRQEVQRLLFWSTMLSGHAGFTYGADGIWAVNREGAPFGPSPHPLMWGDTPWTEAYRLPGAEQVALGKELLAEYDWWRIAPCRDRVESLADEGAASTGDGSPRLDPLAGRIGEEVYVVYVPPPSVVPQERFRITGLDPAGAYDARFVDPTNGRSYPLGEITPDDDGAWEAPQHRILRDQLLIVERV